MGRTPPILPPGTLTRLPPPARPLEGLFVRGTRDAVIDQVTAGIDIPTDGEIRRENYIHYHCRHLDGIDFTQLTERVLREGAYAARLPTVTGPISARDRFLPHDWRVAQGFTDKPVKISIPGPMTISDTLADAYYGDPRHLAADLAAALNTEVLALAEAGCRHIQNRRACIRPQGRSGS